MAVRSFRIREAKDEAERLHCVLRRHRATWTSADVASDDGDGAGWDLSCEKLHHVGQAKSLRKSHDYLWTREEAAWYSCAEGRTDVTFNIPLTNELRGYDGFNKNYKAKSPYKRVTNVWSDIPELFKPKIQCEKPVPLMERLVLTHSNPGDLIVDVFCGRGTTGVAALMHGRRFRGCEVKPELAAEANQRCVEAAEKASAA